MKKVITYFITFALAVLMITAALALPAFAEEVATEAVTEGVTEEISETAAETETSVPLDEWLYEAIKQATPEQVEMIEEIVMGGLNALDKLGIKGFDRVRIWVEYNTATVMVIALAVALVLFFIGTMIQKRGFAKKADVLNANAIEMYNEGQAATATAQKVCRECAEAAMQAAESAKAANGQVTEERALLMAELDKNARVNQAMCETVEFLLECSDLSQAKRDEAHAIYQRGVDALHGYTEAPTERTSKEVMADENNHQA